MAASAGSGHGAAVHHLVDPLVAHAAEVEVASVGLFRDVQEAEVLEFAVGRCPSIVGQSVSLPERAWQQRRT
jgi:hypothetical protein